MLLFSKLPVHETQCGVNLKDCGKHTVSRHCPFQNLPQELLPFCLSRRTSHTSLHKTFVPTHGTSCMYQSVPCPLIHRGPCGVLLPESPRPLPSSGELRLLLRTSDMTTPMTSSANSPGEVTRLRAFPQCFAHTSSTALATLHTSYRRMGRFPPIGCLSQRYHFQSLCLAKCLSSGKRFVPVC